MGRPKGTKMHDFNTTVVFLRKLRAKPLCVYEIYRTGDFDIRKLYRYLRYCLSMGLLELDKVAGSPLFFLG